MKLKFINCLLASVLLVGSAQVFTSCKDNESDLIANLKVDSDKEHQQLKDAIKKNADDLVEAKNDLQGQIDALKQKDIDLTEAIKQQGQELTALINGNQEANQAEIARLEGLITENTQELVSVRADIETINTAIDGINQSLDGILQRLDTMDVTIKGLGTKLSELEVTVQEQAAIISELQAGLTLVKAALENLTDRVEALEDFRNQWKSVLPEIQQQAALALMTANANAAEIDAIQSVLEDLKLNDQANASAISSLQAQVNAILASLDGMATLEDLEAATHYLQEQAEENYRNTIKYINLLIDQLDRKFNNYLTIAEFKRIMAEKEAALKSELNQLKADLAALETSVNEQFEAINGAIKNLKNRINGITIHQTRCNAFGTFNFPVGVSSRMLIAFMGETTQPVSFPVLSDQAGYYSGNSTLTREDWARINGQQAIVEDGYIMQPGEKDGYGYLGRIYMSVNPSNVDITNQDYYKFSINNSRGESQDVVLNIEPSQELLNFGYGRGVSEYGFYAADADIPLTKESLDKIRFTLNDDFKSTVKEILSAPRSLTSASTIAQLGNAVYNQFNGVLPALAVTASWNEDGQALYASSEYGMAIAVAKPLSFQFLADKSLRNIPNLPDLSRIENVVDRLFEDVKGQINLKLYDPENPFTIVWNDITFKINATIKWPESKVENPTIEIVIYDTSNTEVGRGSEEVDIAGPINSVMSGIESAVDKAFATLKSQVEENMATLNTQIKNMVMSIQTQVRDLLEGMQTNIDEQIETVLNNLQGTVNGKIESVLNRISGLTDKVQAIINRINNVLTSPNYYLQPTLLYKAGSHFGMASTLESWPTQFVLNGGNAVTLVPTTYTLESVAPAFKKYVAVSKVWANGDASKTNVQSVMDDANSQEFMNDTNIPGERYTFPLKLQKGYTYEIYYQALDYSGIASGRKYYVTVK